MVKQTCTPPSSLNIFMIFQLWHSLLMLFPLLGIHSPTCICLKPRATKKSILTNLFQFLNSIYYSTSHILYDTWMTETQCKIRYFHIVPHLLGCKFPGSCLIHLCIQKVWQTAFKMVYLYNCSTWCNHSKIDYHWCTFAYFIWKILVSSISTTC